MAGAEDVLVSQDATHGGSVVCPHLVYLTRGLGAVLGIRAILALLPRVACGGTGCRYRSVLRLHFQDGEFVPYLVIYGATEGLKVMIKLLYR